MKTVSSCPEFCSGSIVITNSAIFALEKSYYQDHKLNPRDERKNSFFFSSLCIKKNKYFIIGDKVTVFLIISRTKQNPIGFFLLFDKNCDLAL